MNFLRFWDDLSMWNKLGLAFVAAVAVIGVIFLFLP